MSHKHLDNKPNTHTHILHECQHEFTRLACPGLLLKLDLRWSAVKEMARDEEDGGKKEKEDVKVSGFLHAPLTGHTTKSLLASPPPLVFVSSKQPGSLHHTPTV